MWVAWQSRAVVIDLGLDRDAPAQRLRDWWRLHRLARLLRPVALAVCAALVLAAAGSAPSPGPGLVEVASLPLDDSADFVVLGDRLFVTSVDPSSDVRWLLSAYELPGGRPLWTAPYESSIEQVVDVQRGDGVVLVTGLVAGEGLAKPTTALDAETGQVRWVVPVQMTVAGDGRTGLVGGWVREGELSGSTVRGIDLRTGLDVWSATFPVPASIRPLPDGRALVLTSTGEGQLRDPRTGAVLQARTILPPGTVPNLSILVGDSILVGYQEASGVRGVVAYAGETLERRWGRTLPDDDVTRFGSCGPLVCTTRSGGVEAVDPVTGAPVWDTAEADFVFESGGILVAARGPEWLAAVDPASGRTLVGLDDWDTAGIARDDSALVAIGRATTGSRSWLATVEARTGQMRVLGVVSDRVWDCVTGTASVVCRAPTDRLRVWTYPG